MSGSEGPPIVLKYRLEVGSIKDIRNAVQAVRRQKPDSHLADLAERRLMALASELGFALTD